MPHPADIVFGGLMWEAVIAHLLRPTSGGRAVDEQLAFVLAGHSATAAGLRLTAHELLLADSTDLDHQSPGGIGPTPEFVARALSRCRTEGWSLIEMHSHPFDTSDRTSFSGIDWSNDRLKLPRLSASLPFHATMVTGRQSLDAHYFDRDKQDIRPIRRVTIVGPHFDQTGVAHFIPSGMTRPEPIDADEQHVRQLAVLGAATQQRLARSTIAVVGLGGLGSFVAQQLAHLGAGKLVLIDPDVVEVSNLNRLLGATHSDIGRPKVTVFEKILQGISPHTDVVTVTESILTSDSLDAAKTADVLVGCVDNHGARMILNQLAMRYIIPLIDAGTGIRISTDSTDIRIGGQVQYVAPGLGCLECRGFIDARRAAFDLSTAEEQAYERAHGYGTEEPAPSVVQLNGVVASIQVSEVVKLLASGVEPWRNYDTVIYDAAAQKMFPVTASRRSECVTCGVEGVVGVADLAPLHRSAGSSTLRKFSRDLIAETAV